MDFSHEKYEFLLETWGGFYNKEHRQIHKQEAGSFFFSTMQDLQAYLENLQETESKHQAYHLMWRIEEGKHVRYRTVAKLKLNYKGHTYDYERDFGYAFPLDAARDFFDWHFSCDCNLSEALKETYGDAIEQLECGNTITLESLHLEQVRQGN